jgi:hypothetical protein
MTGDHRRQLSNVQHHPWPEPARWASERFPQPVLTPFEQEQLDATTRSSPLTEEPCCTHPRLIDDNEVRAIQEVSQIQEAMV